MKKLFIYIGLAFVIGCGATTGRIEYIDINYKFTDHKDDGKIVLEYQNDKAKAVCLGAENWPSNGVLLNNGKEVYLEINSEKSYLQAAQDYCPYCVTEVEPNETVHASLDYTLFGVPDRLKSLNKTLHMRSVGYYCSANRKRPY